MNEVSKKNSDNKEYKYTVLMSVYHKDDENYFFESLESMAGQTIPPAQFVIVRDGKVGEEITSVIESFIEKYSDCFQIDIVEIERCSGLGNALNEGLKRCQYDIICRMDSDDISAHNRVEKQLQAMEEHHAQIVGCNVLEFKGDISNIISKRKVPKDHDEILRFAKQRNPFNHPSIIMRKDSILKAGGYIPYEWFEDYYLWVRMLQAGCRAYNVQENLLYMRAGEELFARRGGLKYGIKAVSFKWKIHRMKFSSFWDFIKSASIHFIVSIIPNNLRICFYKKVLRSKK